MGCCTEAELTSKKRFEEVYKRSKTPVMQAIERQVCGCDYGGNSWTTRIQADELTRMLGLDADTKLVDLGAGTGWPALYMAKKSGCKATLVDLPEISLRLARERSKKDGLSNRVTVLLADAAELPLADASFNAISHSDLLCCLVQKQKVLEECRRIIRRDGRMAFTVISIISGLSDCDHARARANGPEFTETRDGYATLLERTGWALENHIDLTKHYEESCALQLQADIEHRVALEELLGADDTAERIAHWRTKCEAIRDGLFLRELFFCRPTAYG